MTARARWMGLILGFVLCAHSAYAADFMSWGKEVFKHAEVDAMRRETFVIHAACVSEGEPDARSCNEQRTGKVADLLIVVNANEAWSSAPILWQMSMSTYVMCGSDTAFRLLPAIFDKVNLRVVDSKNQELSSGWQLMGGTCAEWLRLLAIQ